MLARSLFNLLEGAVLGLISGALVSPAWNHVMPVFGVPRLSMTQAAALLFIAGFVPASIVSSARHPDQHPAERLAQRALEWSKPKVINILTTLRTAIRRATQGSGHDDSR